jgi:hypothetical protein
MTQIANRAGEIKTVGNSGGGGGGIMDMLGPLGDFLGGPMGQVLGPLLGGLFGANNAQQGIDQIQQNIAFNPFSGNIAGAGGFHLGPGGGVFNLDPGLQAGAAGIQGMLPGLFGGGPFAGQAAGSGVNLAGAISQSDAALGTSAQPFFNQQSFANNMANVNQLGNMFTGNVQQGIQDNTGFRGDMFNRGFGFLDQAQDVSGLINQSLDAARTLAGPEEARIANNFFDREFMGTRGATTGAQDRRFSEANSAQMRDAQRVLNAQGLGLQEQQMLLGAGQGMLGLGNQAFGQDLAAFGQNIQGAQDFARLGAGMEGQGFQQMLQALNQDQSAGTQRVTNALNVLGFGQDAFSQSVGLGLGGFEGLLGLGEFGTNSVAQMLNAEANRIGATGLSNQAIAQLFGNKGGFLSGLF